MRSHKDHHLSIYSSKAHETVCLSFDFLGSQGAMRPDYYVLNDGPKLSQHHHRRGEGAGSHHQ